MADNYLDGSVVTFSCKPDFLIHGEQTRHCVNGTWSPGWWAWCRGEWLLNCQLMVNGSKLILDRNLEYGLKWLTAILTSLAIIMICTGIFCCCWRRRFADFNNFIEFLFAENVLKKTAWFRTPDSAHRDRQLVASRLVCREGIAQGTVLPRNW